MYGALSALTHTPLPLPSKWSCVIIYSAGGLDMCKFSHVPHDPLGGTHAYLLTYLLNYSMQHSPS